MATWPTAEQIQTFIDAPQDQPIVICNILSLKPGPDGMPDPETWSKMMEYSVAMGQFVERAGAEFVFAGRINQQFLGEGGEHFHFLSVMRYPSRQTYLELAGDPEVAATIARARDEALDSQWIFTMDEVNQ